MQPVTMPNAHPNWPVDGHVHFHSLSRVEPTLDAALAGFRAAGGREAGLMGALLLTQISGETVFEALRQASSAGAWRICPAAHEPESLVARRDGVGIAVVCGRQVRAADGVEVLGLGTCATFRDGLPLQDTVSAVRGSGALTALPWGFGKWWGERGRRVERLVNDLGANAVFLGDNGSRPRAMGRPGLIETGERKGFRVLPGTDPFPIAAGYRRVGSFGFYCDFEPPEDAPWGALRRWLESRTSSPLAYGRATGALRFVLDQVGLRVQKNA